MKTDKKTLAHVYQRSSGYCHLCHAKLSLKNHGLLGRKGAWHIEHSVPSSKGGTNHLNNLYPACIKCNLKKGNRSTHSARRENGKTRAPMSTKRRRQIKQENGFLGAMGGGTIGFAVAGPLGALAGALIGRQVGRNQNPDK